MAEEEEAPAARGAPSSPAGGEETGDLKRGRGRPWCAQRRGGGCSKRQVGERDDIIKHT